MRYQRAAVRSIYGYHVIKLCSQSSKSSKGCKCLFFFKGGWPLLIKRHSIKVTLKPVLLLTGMEKLSKPDEWLQNKWCSFIAKSLSPFILFPVRTEFPRCSRVLTFTHSKMRFSFAIMFLNHQKLYRWLHCCLYYSKTKHHLKSECVNTLEFLLLLEKEWNEIMILS